ncbi:hypothetical protein [uncultured Subdoligranulum sp.]|uniref:hypothetical protein n=1 Tax=uncultured Subdoligranulum sp. TaxID=512298 RepID=UPI0025EE180B|nr:hypothetical protein [uncultured Subdoligranulum sp.]
MQFEQDLFKEYKRIMETTNLQKCYQQILKLIRCISSGLAKIAIPAPSARDLSTTFTH